MKLKFAVLYQCLTLGRKLEDSGFQIARIVAQGQAS
jgi:hypothetical protein